MQRGEFINLLSAKVKLVRAEYDLSQDKMAHVLGLSKKTLIQVEKGRNQLSWTAAVALAAIFRESEVIQAALSESPVEVAETLALTSLERPKKKTLGGRVWWKLVTQAGEYRVQQNVITGHYRILDRADYRWYSSFDEDYIQAKLQLLVSDKKRNQQDQV